MGIIIFVESMISEISALDGFCDEDVHGQGINWVF